MAVTPRVPAPSPDQFAHPPAPFVAPLAGDIEQRLSLVAAAINRKADRTATPNFTWVTLVSPNGTNYAVSVDDSGNLHTTQVLRS